jgi:hypothetical protein
MALSIYCERLPVDGFLLSTMSDGNGKRELNYFCQRFIGYTRKEAERLLLDEVRAFYGVKRVNS